MRTNLLFFSFFYFLSLGTSSLSFSQENIEKSLSDCKDQLEKLENFQLNVTTLVFFNSTSTRAGLTDDSKLIKKGNNFLIIRKESIFFSDPQKSILVDNQLQSILIKFYKKSKAKPFDFVGLGDTSYKRYQKVEPISSGQQIGYKLKYLNSVFSTAQLFFNPKSKLIEKIVYHYNQELSTDVYKCELLYNFLSKSDSAFDPYFTSSYFVTKNGKDYLPGASFRNFVVQVVQD
jgi:hypothetical protein